MSIVIIGVLCLWLAVDVRGIRYIGVLVDTSGLRKGVLGPTNPQQPGSLSPFLGQSYQPSPSTYGSPRSAQQEDDDDDDEEETAEDIDSIVNEIVALSMRPGSKRANPEEVRAAVSRMSPEKLIELDDNLKSMKKDMDSLKDSVVNDIVTLSVRPDGATADPEVVRHSLDQMPPEKVEELSKDIINIKLDPISLEEFDKLVERFYRQRQDKPFNPGP